MGDLLGFCWECTPGNSGSLRRETPVDRLLEMDTIGGVEGWQSSGASRKQGRFDEMNGFRSRSLVTARVPRLPRICTSTVLSYCRCGYVFTKLVVKCARAVVFGQRRLTPMLPHSAPEEYVTISGSGLGRQVGSERQGWRPASAGRWNAASAAHRFFPNGLCP